MKTFSAWYAVRTASRAEKKIYERLLQAGVETYLPLYTAVRQWSDRKKRVRLPLLPGYLFVHLPESAFLTVLQVPGVCGILKEEGKAVAIPDSQIGRLRLAERHCAENLRPAEAPIPVGTPVIIDEGPLKGITGELVAHGGNDYIVLRIEKLGCALLKMEQKCIKRLKN